MAMFMRVHHVVHCQTDMRTVDVRAVAVNTLKDTL